MREMVLDVMHLRFDLDPVDLLELFLDRGRASEVLDFLRDKFRVRKMGEPKRDSPPIVHARLPVDRARWNTGPMFDPPKTLFFGRGHKFAINKQAGGRITVISVKPEDLHPK